jgi:hypothetical protein
VQWCLHGTTAFDGHGWWEKADEAIWDFFTALPIVELTEGPPPGGGNSQVVAGYTSTMTLTINFPETLGPVVLTGLFLYPEGSELPISGAPVQILNGNVELGADLPGTQRTLEIPVRLPQEVKLPENYTLVLAVYVEGGSIPIPTPGVDHNAIEDVSVNDSTTPIVLTDVLYLEAI